MAYQGHLTRRIEQLGMVLRRLLSGLTGQHEPGEVRISTEEAQNELGEELGSMPDTLTIRSPIDLHTVLAHSAYSEANADLLAELLIAMADRTEDAAHRTQLHHPALAILDHLNTLSTTFNIERHTTVVRLCTLV